MSNNSYKYHVFIHDEDGIAQSSYLGFNTGKVSTDELLCIYDKGDSVEEPINNAPTKPSYVVETFPNWPHLNHEEAVKFVKYIATTIGASDGFSVTKTTPAP